MTDQRKAELRGLAQSDYCLKSAGLSRQALPELLDEVDRLTSERDAEKRRADAAFNDLAAICCVDCLCKFCLHDNDLSKRYDTEEFFSQNSAGHCWIWRGPCPENTEGAEKDG